MRGDRGPLRVKLSRTQYEPTAAAKLDEPADRAGLILEMATAVMSLSPRNGERAARRIARASIRTGLPAARPRMPAKQKGIW